MRGRQLCLPLLLGLLLTGLAQSAYLEVSLDRSPGEANAPLYSLSLDRAATWIVRWNHSVTGITVSDYYYWDGSNLILTHSHTPAFDAGLGHIPGRGRLAGDGLGGYWIYGINEPVPNNGYPLRVGSSRVNHRIIHGAKVYSLSRVAANKRVRIEVVLK